MIDKLITCTKCDSVDAVYRQEFPNDVVIETCLGCGYMTNLVMTKDSQLLKEQLEILPEIYKILISEDEEGKIWIPSFINTPSHGIIYANGNSRDNWWWEAVKYKKLKVPEVKNHKKIVEKINPKSMKKFDELNYLDALDYLKLL